MIVEPMTLDQWEAEARQDGMTPDEWKAAQFEFELCHECGLDAEDHTMTSGPTGHFFAHCNRHPDADESAWRARYREVRGEDAPEL